MLGEKPTGRLIDEASGVMSLHLRLTSEDGLARTLVFRRMRQESG
jgi:hypothetical protein